MCVFVFVSVLQANEVAPDGGNSALSKYQAENAALRMALYETVR